ANGLSRAGCFPGERGGGGGVAWQQSQDVLRRLFRAGRFRSCGRQEADNDPRLLADAHLNLCCARLPRRTKRAGDVGLGNSGRASGHDYCSQRCRPLSSASNRCSASRLRSRTASRWRSPAKPYTSAGGRVLAVSAVSAAGNTAGGGCRSGGGSRSSSPLLVPLIPLAPRTSLVLDIA